jgi:transposase InsO family protein
VGGRGRQHGKEQRELILALVDEAVGQGARRTAACAEVGLSVRTIQRWRAQGGGADARRGPRKPPANKLSSEERQKVLETVNLPEFRNLPPNQIVPRLADQKIYLASESTMYRILREDKQLAHRQRSRPATQSRPREYVAMGPCDVWSWDITYLRSSVRGIFFYLYMIVDIWSRKIVGWEIHECESTELAAELFQRTCTELNLDPTGLVLHQDNGGPMKGSTMLATLQSLGVVASFSRPRVSDDNPYSEALFRTLKYRPEYPSDPFGSVQDARTWVASFVAWYNTQHQHSAIRFVTPEQRHEGLDHAILNKRHAVYQLARSRNPSRWSRTTRNWKPVLEVGLNQRRPTKSGSPQSKAA